MTRYLLDTNTLTVLEDRTKPGFAHVISRLASLEDEDEVQMSILSAYEYRHGIAKAQEPLKKVLIDSWRHFVERFSLVDLSLEGALHYGELKTQYQEHVGAKDRALARSTIDLMLAGSALEHHAVLVSGDQIFQTLRRISPLRVENWLTPPAESPAH